MALSLSSPHPPGPDRGRRRALLFALLATALLAAVVFRHGPRLYDDAFITLRYARNVVDGHGLVYNPGERVLGTSAPLFALLLAIPALVLGTDALPAVAVTFGIAAFAGTAFLAFRLLSRYAGPWIAALGVATALTPIDALQAFASGMETPLYLLGIVFAVERLASGRLRPAFYAAAALPFVHPEAALLFPALFLAARASGGRWPWRELFGPVAAAAAAGFALFLAYGSPLPHSVTAKRLIYDRAPASALRDIGSSPFEPFLPPPVPPSVADSIGGVVVASEILFLLASLGLLAAVLLRQRAALRNGPILALAVFGGLYVAFFGVGNPLVFPWYRPPLELAAGLVVTALLGLSLRAPGPKTVPRAFAALLLVSVAARLAVFRPFDTRLREDVYIEAALLLAPPAGAVVAAPEIGVVGFYTDARILDTAGLVSPRALRFSRSPLAMQGRRNGTSWAAGTIPPGLVAAFGPGYVVSLSRFLKALLAVEPSALDGYVPVDVGPHAREAELLVYRRVATGPASPASTPSARRSSPR